VSGNGCLNTPQKLGQVFTEQYVLEIEGLMWVYVRSYNFAKLCCQCSVEFNLIMRLALNFN